MPALLFELEIINDLCFVSGYISWVCNKVLLNWNMPAFGWLWRTWPAAASRSKKHWCRWQVILGSSICIGSAAPTAKWLIAYNHKWIACNDQWLHAVYLCSCIAHRDQLLLQKFASYELKLQTIPYVKWTICCCIFFSMLLVFATGRRFSNRYCKSSMLSDRVIACSVYLCNLILTLVVYYIFRSSNTAHTLIW